MSFLELGINYRSEILLIRKSISGFFKVLSSVLKLFRNQVLFLYFIYLIDER